jgi:hypothetical protein
MHHLGQGESGRTHEVVVYQCPNGCVHIRMDNITLSFSQSEFAQFAHLIQKTSLDLRLPSHKPIKPH